MWELFVIFFKLGIFTIGGGIAMVPILRKKMVEELKWFDDDEMVDIIAICQGLPGVLAVNMATFVGYKKKKLPGAFVATLGVIIPSFVIILVIARFLSEFEENVYSQGALGGLKAAAAALVLLAVWQVGRTAVSDWFSAVCAAGAFVLIVFCKISVVYVIILFLAIGVAKEFLFPGRPAIDPDAMTKAKVPGGSKNKEKGGDEK